MNDDVLASREEEWSEAAFTEETEFYEVSFPEEEGLREDGEFHEEEGFHTEADTNEVKG